jgi:hypothetical protein
VKGPAPTLGIPWRKQDKSRPNKNLGTRTRRNGVKSRAETTTGSVIRFIGATIGCERFSEEKKLGPSIGGAIAVGRKAGDFVINACGL